MEASASHGVLVLQRNNRNLLLLVDGKAAFRTIEGNEATFRLPPGRHRVVAMHTATEGNSAVTAGPLETSVDLSSGGRVALGVVVAGGGIRFVRP